MAYVDICTPPTQSLLKLFAERATNQKEKEMLEELGRVRNISNFSSLDFCDSCIFYIL